MEDEKKVHAFMKDPGEELINLDTKTKLKIHQMNLKIKCQDIYLQKLRMYDIVIIIMMIIGEN